MKGNPKKSEVLERLRRIEGQMRGLQRIISEEVPCPDILLQVAAARAALKKVGVVILQSYTEKCLGKFKEKPRNIQVEMLGELQKVIGRYFNLA